jgi:hypothetical protein
MLGSARVIKEQSMTPVQFDMLDATTFCFVCQLKTRNHFWFLNILKAAKHGPKCLKQMIGKIKVNEVPLDFDAATVNIFQICQAVNKGALHEDSFAFLGDKVWHYHRNSMMLRIQKEIFG